MAGNILVMKGISRYNVVRLMADETIEGFTKLGCQVTVVDLETDNDTENLIKIIFQKQYDLIFSFQALCFELRLSDNVSSFLNALNIPIFGHIVDLPIYHSFRLESSQGDNIHLGCIDRNHLKFIREYYPHIKNVYYLPHAGFTPVNNRPYLERSIDIYFPSSYKSPADAMKSIEELPDVYKNMSLIFIRQLLENPMLTLQDALSNYLDTVKFEHTLAEFTQMLTIVHVVDLYIRSYTRDRLLCFLLDNGINVTVSGNGWDKFIPISGHNITVVASEGLDIIDTLDIMGNSKMILNHVPTLQDGMHERIFSSMRCGAISLTNDFPCIHEEFTDGENLLLYSDDNLQSFVEKIKHFIDHPEEARIIAENGNKIAEASHTWHHNAQQILRITGLIE